MADSSDVRNPKSAVNGKTAPAKANFLSQKIAGVPVWIILAVLVIGLIIYQKKKSSTAATASTATGTQAGANLANQGAAGGLGGGYYGPANALELGLAANAQAPTTNSQWEANAEAILVGEGYPFVQIQAALNQYLAGGVLSSVQQEIVNAAIVVAGSPPSPPTSAPVGTATPPPGGTGGVTPTTGAQPATGGMGNLAGYTELSTSQQAQEAVTGGETLYVDLNGQPVPVSQAGNEPLPLNTPEYIPLSNPAPTSS